ncbi:dynein assembly factor 1, axonemal isoform X3 [Corvus kubaryi]|uniref:dynein assembly factor 1, axonemal isoform X3 n=1 Tax=Corvus kubaryi TaxID=68294 RepID=UPI001C03E7AB|nr:dynein assembly factor 1, axonemal isoform X3 [Corvus kubaryi]
MQAAPAGDPGSGRGGGVPAPEASGAPLGDTGSGGAHKEREGSAVSTAIKTQEKEVNCMSRTDQQNEQKSGTDQKSGTSSSSQRTEEKRGSVRMTKKILLDVCKQQKLYWTPYLNDILYLHYKACLKVLQTLQIAHNKLRTVEDIQHLQECPSISVLDLSHNNLSDPSIVAILELMPNLHVLNLMGNEVIKKIANYRKTLTVRLKQLTYLDDRPVFPKDRACAEAWAVGGLEAEKAEREKWETRERKKIQDSIDALAAIRQRAEEKRRQKCMEGVATDTLEGAPVNSKDGDGNSNTSETSNRSEEEAEEKTEKFKNAGFDVCDEAITLLPNRGDNRDFTSGNMPDEVREGAQEPDSYKCTNFNEETDGNVPSEEPNQRQEAATDKAMLPERDEYAEIEQFKLETLEKLSLDELPDLEDVVLSEFPPEDEIFVQERDCHPKIEIISEVTNDCSSALEKNNKSTLENSIGEVPTAIFSSVCQNHKAREKEHLRPLLKSFFTQPDNSERYLEIKDKEVVPLKPLIQEVITEPQDDLLLSPVCHQPDDPSSWEEDGNGSVGEAQGLAEGEGCPHKAQGDEDGESGLD